MPDTASAAGRPLTHGASLQAFQPVFSASAFLRSAPAAAAVRH